MESFNFIVFNSTSANILMRDFAPYVRPADLVTLVSGNNAAALDMAFVNSAARRLKEAFPEIKVEAVTCGRANLRILAGQAAPPIRAVGHICEPGQANNPDFQADEAWALAFFREATTIARSRGFLSVAHPTGRPVLGLGMPRWDYGKLSLETDEMFIQTQTYCRRGDFDAAISRLVQQFQQAKAGSMPAPQITVGLTNVNAVSAERAVECVATAKRHGVRVITVWWETDNSAENAKFLELARPVTDAAVDLS